MITKPGLLRSLLRAPSSRARSMLPGRKSDFGVGFRQESNRENLKISPPAGRPKADLMLTRMESGRNPARKPDLRPGNIIA